MKDREILKYVEENNLSSVMNNTKWKKLVGAITSNNDFDPPVNFKTIFDDKNNGTFTPVWWDEIERHGFNIIEWLQIKPIKEEHTGQLTKPQVTDYTEFIKGCLEVNSINYTFEGGIFKIIGYQRTR
jgi:hypothetical protein